MIRGRMSDISRKRWRAALAVMVGFAAVALAGPSLAGAATLARGAGHAKAGAREGIVQSVSAKAIVLRELDGTTVSIPVAVSTHVFVDGRRASLRDVKAGFVASAAWTAGKPARVLQAFDLLSPHAVTVGVVDSVSTGVLIVKESDGTKVSIPVNARTRVLIDGKPAKIAAVKRGYTVVIPARDSKGDKPAHELRFLRPV
jgi:hypothetical protein